jgi:hypothetical protein
MHLAFFQKEEKFQSYLAKNGENNNSNMIQATSHSTIQVISFISNKIEQEFIKQEIKGRRQEKYNK